MSLRDAVKKLDNLIDDLSSLHVQTYTGDLEVDVNGVEGGMESIRNTISQAKADGKVVLVAESYYQFDGDSFNFVSQPNDNIPKNAMDLHDAAVATGMQTRLSLVEFVKDAFD